MSSYSCIWEYRVRPDYLAQFERHYGPDGTWVRLFEKATGYVGTVLLRDRAQPLRYVTIDTWESAEAYQAFRSRFEARYRAVDDLCASFTTEEVSLGEYSGFSPNSSLERGRDR